MGSGGGLDVFQTDAGRNGTNATSTMDSEQRIIQVINAMRSEIRKLQLENIGLRRRASPNVRKNATVPIMTAQCRESVVMTVRRYSIFQLLNRRNLQFDESERLTEN
ncbi:uncharacterized protein V6R79_021596 [Siganus canaliculatus]